MITLPATNNAAPTNHRGGRDSEKIIAPRRAVIMKLEEVLRMDTCVVDVPRARALVNRVHMMALNKRLRRKKICISGHVC
jgi:hypothetical protein